MSEQHSRTCAYRWGLDCDCGAEERILSDHLHNAETAYLTLEAENKRLREALRWRIKWEQSVIDQCPTLGFLGLGGAYCRGLRIVAESKERAAMVQEEAR